MYKCNQCGSNECHMTICKTTRGNMQVMVCKECGDIISFITQSPCTKETDINLIATAIHKNAVDHGWWEDVRPPAEIIALCHSELSEALECFRNNEPAEWYGKAPAYGGMVEYLSPTDPYYKGEKTEGWATELVDCVIRIFDYLAYKGVDIENVMLRKHEYNKTRPYKHGKKF